jgi:hypothetical protein
VLVAAIAAAFSPHRAGAAASAPRPLFSLDALLTVAPDLPVLARSVLVSEAAQIWRREGVALRWVAAPESGRPSAPLRVLVISRRESVAAGTSVWTVGELVPHNGQRALAIASIAGAERVVKASSQLRLLDGQEALQYRLGVVLGRALAHEIGHYLLATPTHAERGLMRATIDAREFADPGARTFALDDAAGEWLRSRLVETPVSEAALPLPATGFTYGQPVVDAISER